MMAAARLLLCLAALLPSAAALAPPVKSVGIVGAGPAGLALAVALEKLGDFDVTVFDQSDSLRPALGGGVQLNSGAAVLAKLSPSLGAGLRELESPVRRVLSRTVDGSTLLDLDLEAAILGDGRSRGAGLVDDAGAGVRAYTVMRDALQALLRAECERTTFELGSRVRATRRRREGGAEVVLEDGRAVAFNVVAGCDGVRGASRGGRPGAEPLAAVGKRVRIRWGVSSRPSRSTRDELHQWFGPGGVYCLAGSYGGRGGAKFDQCVVVSPAPAAVAAKPWEPAPDVRDAMVAKLEAAAMPRDIVDLARSCDRCFDLGAEYANPLPPWRSDGGAVLVGDAAHCMPPFLGQGTNQAIQDAYCLATKLAALNAGEFATVDDAVDAYEADRKFPVARLGFNSVVLGAVETLLPEWFRDGFFRATSALGVARFVFLDGAMPKV